MRSSASTPASSSPGWMFDAGATMATVSPGWSAGGLMRVGCAGCCAADIRPILPEVFSAADQLRRPIEVDRLALPADRLDAAGRRHLQRRHGLLRQDGCY